MALSQTVDNQLMTVWDCSKCSTQNNTESPICSLCGEQRAKSSGWKCTRCTFHNTTANQQCAMCRSQRANGPNNNPKKRKCQPLIEESTERPHKKRRSNANTDSPLTPSPSSSVPCHSMDCCPVCGRNLLSVSINTRHLHISVCLDLKTRSTTKYPPNRPSNPTPKHNVPQSTPSSTKSTVSMSSTGSNPRGRPWRRSKAKRKVQQNGLMRYFGTSSTKQDRPKTNDLNTKSNDSFNRDRLSVKEHYLRFKMLFQTNVVIDGFVGWNRFAPRNAVYLLSHFHSDHYVGLSAGQFEGGTIYCSEITARLVTSRLGVDSQCIHSLPMFTKCRLPHAEPPTFVTLLDANHCPGAVMMLFEVHYAADRVSLHLHLGDARCEMEADSLFHRKNKALLHSVYGRIDRLYLDTTYLSTKMVLPRQSDAVQFVADRCRSLLDEGGDLVILIGTYTIGKERILQRVAEQCRCPIFIESWKRSIFRAVYGPDDPLNGGTFTADPEATKIRVVSMRNIQFSTMRTFKTSESTKVVGFKPTGWTSKDGGGRRASDDHVISPRFQSKAGGAAMVIYDIPYSEHSSFPELCKFVNDVRPQRIVPTVSNWSRSGIQKQIQALEAGMEAFAVNGYRYLPLIEDNGLKQTSITQFIASKNSERE